MIHLAAIPDIAKAITQPDIDLRGSAFLVQNTLETARIIGAKRLIVFSASQAQLQSFRDCAR